MSNDDIRETPAKTRKQEVNLYFDLTGGDYTVFRSSGMAKQFPAQYVLMATQEVEFAITKSDDELTQAQVEGLREARRNILAEAEVKAARIQQQIQNILAITHEPSTLTP
jgi:hypothetical protein